MRNKIKAVLVLILFLYTLLPSSASWFSKKQQTSVFLTSYNPLTQTNYDTVIKSQDFFKINTRIYFQVFNPNGFKSDYIKFQIVKQDDNAHTGGYTRIQNKTKRVKDKNYFCDYFVLSEAGKYFIQIFDIENLQHWLVLAHFRVVGD